MGWLNGTVGGMGTITQQINVIFCGLRVDIRWIKPSTRFSVRSKTLSDVGEWTRVNLIVG